MALSFDVSAPLGGLLGTLIATLLYGINFCVYFSAVYVLVRKQKRAGRQHEDYSFSLVLLFISTVQFIVSTTHVGLGWRMLIDAFVDHANAPGESLAYFRAFPLTVGQIVQRVLIIINSIFADTVLIWRLYVVWGGNWHVCVPPVILIVAYSVIYLIAVSMLQSLAGPSILAFSNWMIIALAISALTHTSVTTSITIRIWQISRASAQGICAGLSSGRKRVMLMILESGAIYSTTVILFVVFASYKSAIGGILAPVLVQISGLIPTLIIVRARLGLSVCGLDTTTVSSVTSISFDLTPGVADIESASIHSSRATEYDNTRIPRDP